MVAMPTVLIEIPRETRRILWALLIALTLESAALFTWHQASPGLVLPAGEARQALNLRLAPSVPAPIQQGFLPAEKTHSHPRKTSLHSTSHAVPVLTATTANVSRLRATQISAHSSAPIITTATESTPAQGSLAPATVPPQPSSAEVRFIAHLRQAIHAAVRYPPSERALGRQGVTRVGFVLQDGELRQAEVIRSSGRVLLDRAALQAIANAVLPPVPDLLLGQSPRYQLNVMFKLETAP